MRKRVRKLKIRSKKRARRPKKMRKRIRRKQKRLPRRPPKDLVHCQRTVSTTIFIGTNSIKSRKK